MRIVYGAGAVAVAGVIAVGLVKPDFTATADQAAGNDPNATDPTLVADANATAAAGNGNGRSDQSGSNGQQQNTQTKHVTKYIHLKPGQTAPPGATVITPGQPTPRVVTANHPGPTSAPNHNPKPPANNPPPPNNNPPPTKQPPPPPPPPPPTPRPTQKTHQSGHP